ncbi:zinc-binding alcohol dehydrogenase family protein [Aquabacter spiritensis]|uniref:Zinc-type alcohol dehydrogenase-like protein n=1 Tax=Aquabacter spiritensis TaxID=933073 RepID=A0A4R3M7X2_9HYPH|nr:zinc-binding alcohol dehydrogenase family protein [Aquabacter spiritensis]TCT07727.1 zinc-binding alcohol dehydrogenase family protein [Aquabacter spiritensis]
MKAIGYVQSLPIADARSLFDFEAPEPKIGPRDLLVRVEAISVNPVDTKVRMRRQGTEAEPVILGWDAAGVVEAVGPEATLFKPGDAVYYAGSLPRPGTNAELHAVDERIVGRKPASLSFAQAAALPLTAITAWEGLFDRLRLPVGKAGNGGALLIVGAAGGVGSIAVQLARRLTAFTVIGTASRPETAQWVRELGAHHVIDHSKPLSGELKALGIPEVEAAFALTKTDLHWSEIAAALKPQGAVCVIDDPGPIDIGLLKQKAATFCWEFMFARPLFGTPDMAAQHRLLNEVAGLVDEGLLRTTLGAHFGPICAENLKRAHAALESGTSIGKVVLEGW